MLNSCKELSHKEGLFVPDEGFWSSPGLSHWTRQVFLLVCEVQEALKTHSTILAYNSFLVQHGNICNHHEYFQNNSAIGRTHQVHSGSRIYLYLHSWFLSNTQYQTHSLRRCLIQHAGASWLLQIISFIFLLLRVKNELRVVMVCFALSHYFSCYSCSVF